MPITVTIDGRTTRVEQGTTILRAAHDLGIVIPTLCHNDAVEPYAACRVCIVVASDDKGGWSKIVTSCNYEVWEGLHVDTQSEHVLEARRTVLDLILSAHPNAKPVQELAARYGITEPSYKGDPGDDCILCGLCVRYPLRPVREGLRSGGGRFGARLLQPRAGAQDGLSLSRSVTHLYRMRFLCLRLPDPVPPHRGRRKQAGPVQAEP